MEKACGVHSGAHKSGPGSTSSDRGNSTKKLGRSGSHTPSSGAGSGSASSPAGGGGSRAGTAGNSGSMQQPNRRHLEGVLSKYTNLLQGWQNRYFVLDPELEQLQYFVNEHSRTQKPRGWLPLAGASVTPSDEAPHMFTIYSASGELYKLRASDAKEQQFWMSQLQACARRHSDGSTRATVPSGRARSFSLLPHPPLSSSASSSSASPAGSRATPLAGAPSGIVTITHHKSPAAARRAHSQYPGRLLEVKESGLGYMTFHGSRVGRDTQTFVLTYPYMVR